MQVEITNKHLVIGTVVLVVIGLIVGGYYGYNVYETKRKEVNSLRSQLSEVKVTLEEKTKEIDTLNGNLNLTEEEKKKAQEEASKAQGDLTKANTKLTTTTNKLSATQSELATANYIAENLLGVSGTLASQKEYYEAANTSIMNCLNAISEQYWTTAEYYCKQADQNLEYARSLNSTVNYYLNKLGY